MNIGLYQNAASIDVNERMQALIAQNLASSNMAGYKQVGFAAQGIHTGKLPAHPDSAFSAMLDATMPQLATNRSMEQGALIRTGVPTDLAVKGEGFFQIELPNGETILTRDGNFHLSPDAELVNRYGHPVVGQSGVIQAQPNGGELSVDKRGNVMQNGQVVGQLAIVQAPETDRLLPVPGGFLYPGPELKPVENPEVIAGFYEGSNVSGIRQMVSMIASARLSEASQQAIKSIDEVYENSITTLGQTKQ